MPGYDAKAIARWDVVPYQTFTGEFNVGVVAFHMNGIDRVDFSVNGGAWTPVYEMQLNPQTNVWEYTAQLDASEFADGPIEVRAIAWPQGAGEPRVLGGEIDGAGRAAGEHSLLLSGNANGSLSEAVRFVSPTGNDANNGLTSASPKATVVDALWSIQQLQGNVDGATVYLLAGDHVVSGASWPRSQISNSLRWASIEAAPGVDRADVRVRGAGGDQRPGSVKLLAWRNFTYNAVTGGSILGSWVANSRVWYDGLAVDGGNRTFPSANGTFGHSDFPGGKYATGLLVENVANATVGFTLARDIEIDGILSDAFSGCSMVVNSTVTDINQGSSGAHPDILQYFGWNPTNIVIYGLRSDPSFAYPNGVQGFFVGGGPTITDFAMVDCLIANSPSWSSAFALSGTIKHLFVKDTEFRGSARWLDPSSTENIVFDNVLWPYGSPGNRSGVTYRSRVAP